jgi:hypothetical protein
LSCNERVKPRFGLPQNLDGSRLRRLAAVGRWAHRVYYALDPDARAAFTAAVRQVCDVLGEVEAAATDAPG